MTRTQMARLEALAREVGEIGKRIGVMSEPSQEVADLWSDVRKAGAKDRAVGASIHLDLKAFVGRHEPVEMLQAA